MQKAITPDFEVNYVDFDVNNPNSITSAIREQRRIEHYANTRRTASIRGSQYWRCEQAMLWDARNEPYTNNVYSFNNDLAAEGGNYAHSEFAQLLINAGKTKKIIPFHDDDELRNSAREAGALQYAEEVNLTSYFQPLTLSQQIYYENAHGIIPPQASVIERYMMGKDGVRIDNILSRNNYKGDLITEVKTVGPDYWYDGKYFNFLRKNIREKYIPQLIRQMHWWRNIDDGERPKWGLLLIANRGNLGDTMEEYVEYEPTAIEWWLERNFQTVQKWDRGEEGEAQPSSDECGFCPFWDKCKAPGKFPFTKAMIENARTKKRKANIVPLNLDEDIQFD